MALSKIGTNSISDDAITTAKLPNDAVTSAKIADGTIATANIADDAVGNTKLDLSANYAFTGTVTGSGHIVQSIFEAFYILTAK